MPADFAMASAAEAEVEVICGAPACTERTKVTRMLKIPSDFRGEKYPGAMHYHGKRIDCFCHFRGGEPGKPGRPSGKRVCTGEASRVPVGAIISVEACPPVLAQIDELWACRCAHTPVPHALRTTDCAFAARAGNSFEPTPASTPTLMLTPTPPAMCDPLIAVACAHTYLPTHPAPANRDFVFSRAQVLRYLRHDGRRPR